MQKFNKNMRLKIYLSKRTRQTLLSDCYGLRRFQRFIKKNNKNDKVLREKAFNIANNPKYDRYQRGLSSMVYEVFS